MKKITLRAIADRCGCSVTTVSRVLNGNAEKFRISPKTADAVMAEITRTGYVPSFTAQTLRKKKSGMTPWFPMKPFPRAHSGRYVRLRLPLRHQSLLPL